MFIDHEPERKAYFTRRSQTPITAADNYRYNHGSVNGLWDGVLPDGLGASHYHSYQLLICDNHFFSGFFVSAYTNSCYKDCHSWCNDKQSPYFRTASTNPGYKGVAFNENGHRRLSNRLISVGLR